jgi:hypothetical protein
MRKVFKYDLYGGDKNNFWADLPENAEVLSVGMQSLNLVVWAIIDPAYSKLETHSFHIAGTGHELDECRGEYLNRIDNGQFHFHVFYGGIK